jgi:hypothetical protein
LEAEQARVSPISLEVAQLETPFNVSEPRFDAFEVFALIEKVAMQRPEKSFDRREPALESVDVFEELSHSLLEPPQLLDGGHV